MSYQKRKQRTFYVDEEKIKIVSEMKLSKKTNCDFWVQKSWRVTINKKQYFACEKLTRKEAEDLCFNQWLNNVEQSGMSVVTNVWKVVRGDKKAIEFICEKCEIFFDWKEDEYSCKTSKKSDIFCEFCMDRAKKR